MPVNFADRSPLLIARLAGVFYLLTFVIAGIAVAVSGGLIVPADATATAANVLAHGQRFWLGLTFNLIVIASYLAVTALFYALFRPVNRTVSMQAACFSLVGCAVQAASLAFYAVPVIALGGDTGLRAFSSDQLQALALLCVRLYVLAYNTGLGFFGFYCLLIGWLVLRGGFLPRILGVLMMLGGISWLSFLSPPFAAYLRPYNLAPGVLGEGALTLWLLFRGIDLAKWHERARSGTADAPDPAAAPVVATNARGSGS